MMDAFAAGEGCRVHGTLPVPRVAGDFQLSINAQSLYMLRQVKDQADLNVSHTIHKLSFGPAVPGEVNPLDDFVRTVRKGEPSGTFKYFLKVRPAAVEPNATGADPAAACVVSWCPCSFAS